MTSTLQGRPANRILASLPEADFLRVQPHLTTVPIDTRRMFYKQGGAINEVYFPNGGVVSMTAGMEDGTQVEVATIGDEGVVGVSAAFGALTSAAETMVQVPDGTAEQMAVTAFRTELARMGALRDHVNRYTQAVFALTMQSVACMALHDVPERCCRWLLMTHDRVHRDEFDLSQEYLAMMLGVTRPSVSLAAATLQRSGSIRYHYGRVTVLDRAGLEAGSCECYRIVRHQFEELGI